MSNKIDLDGVSHVVERVFGRAVGQSKVWIGGWSAVVLGVTTLIALLEGPAAAYGIVVLVVLLILFAGSRPDKP